MSDVVKFTGDFYPEIDQHWRFHLLYFLSSYRWVLDLTDQNQYERLVEEGVIISFWDDTVAIVVTIADIFGESWLRIPVH